MKIRITESASQRDDRGFLAMPISDDQLSSIHNIHIASIRPGCIRGNHYHEHQTEYICVLGGRSTFLAVDNESDKRTELTLDGEKCPLIEVPPNVTHALKNTGEEMVYIVCYSDRPFDPDGRDMVRNPILE